jgi:hypothetical protein
VATVRVADLSPAIDVAKSGQLVHLYEHVEKAPSRTTLHPGDGHRSGAHAAITRDAENPIKSAEGLPEARSEAAVATPKTNARRATIC